MRVCTQKGCLGLSENWLKRMSISVHLSLRCFCSWNRTKLSKLHKNTLSLSSNKGSEVRVFLTIWKTKLLATLIYQWISQIWGKRFWLRMSLKSIRKKPIFLKTCWGLVHGIRRRKWPWWKNIPKFFNWDRTSNILISWPECWCKFNKNSANSIWNNLWICWEEATAVHKQSSNIKKNRITTNLYFTKTRKCKFSL